MAEITGVNATLPLPPQRVGASGAEAASASGESGPASPDRTVRDTVALSSGGDQVLNLARGNELARDIRQTTDSKDLSRSLRAALDDIVRIMQRFAETIRSGFAAFRSGFRFFND